MPSKREEDPSCAKMFIVLIKKQSVERTTHDLKDVDE